LQPSLPQARRGRLFSVLPVCRREIGFFHSNAEIKGTMRSELCLPVTNWQHVHGATAFFISKFDIRQSPFIMRAS